jgi:hypothetical protein
MTATIPTPTIRTAGPRSERPHLIIIESSGDRRGPDGSHSSSRPHTGRGLGNRAAGILARVISAISLVVLGVFAVVFTAVWVVVTLALHAVGLGRSGRLRRTTVHPNADPSSAAPSSTAPSSAV